MKMVLIFLQCSIEFDRDDELFATAGVSKRIKVFEFSTVSELLQGTCVSHKPMKRIQFTQIWLILLLRLLTSHQMSTVQLLKWLPDLNSAALAGTSTPRIL
jgi:hypothetical protein